jgi:hypothetical protein
MQKYYLIKITFNEYHFFYLFKSFWSILNQLMPWDVLVQLMKLQKLLYFLVKLLEMNSVLLFIYIKIFKNILIASDDSSFITAELVHVDGGRHAMCPR